MSEEEKRKQRLSEEDLGKVSGGSGNHYNVQPPQAEEDDEDENLVLKRKRGVDRAYPKPSK